MQRMTRSCESGKSCLCVSHNSDGAEGGTETELVCVCMCVVCLLLHLQMADAKLSPLV